ncbi:MAG: hypothetical protein ACI9K5_003851, partial [Gammaproteobacteria bacterium]
EVERGGRGNRAEINVARAQIDRAATTPHRREVSETWASNLN